MKRIKTLISSVIAYLNKKETERNESETLNLLMKLILASDLVEAVEVKRKFDLEFRQYLAQKKIETENNLKAIKSYAN